MYLIIIIKGYVNSYIMSGHYVVGIGEVSAVEMFHVSVGDVIGDCILQKHML